MHAEDADDLPDDLGPAYCAMCKTYVSNTGGTVEFAGAWYCAKCLPLAVASAARLEAVRNPAPQPDPLPPAAPDRVQSDGTGYVASDFCYSCDAPIYGVGATSITVGNHDYCWECAQALAGKGTPASVAAPAVVIAAPAPNPEVVAAVVQPPAVDNDPHSGDFCATCDAPIWRMGTWNISIDGRSYCADCAKKIDPQYA
jgi:hypothetical protein